MDEHTRVSHSKFLSFVLRHAPDVIDIKLDSGGWVSIETLLKHCHEHGKNISRAMLDEIVATSPKRRFAISPDGLRIRANQGHSVAVELGYEAVVPPEILFHGTVKDCVESIRSEGIKRQARHHVHLSADMKTAQMVGGRRGVPVVLRVLAGKMHREGHAFYLSANGVWLTESVPPHFIELPSFLGDPKMLKNKSHDGTKR